MKNIPMWLGVLFVLALALAFARASFVVAQTLPADTTMTDTTTTTDATTPPMDEPEMAVGPTVSSVSVTDITDTSARVDVNSDEMVQGYVEYGTTEAYGTATPLTSEFSTSASFVLEPLTPETLYHYRVIIMDSSGNAGITTDNTFTTLATPASEPEPEPTTETATTTKTTTTAPTTTPTSNATTSSTTAMITTPTTSPAQTTPPPTTTPTPVKKSVTKTVVPVPRQLGIGLPVAPSQPVLVRVTPSDGKVSFEWKKDLGGKNGTVRTLVVRKKGTSYVKSRIDGEIIYDGPSSTFVDTDVKNGVEYHYALYSYGKYNRFTPSANFKVVPRTDKKKIAVPAKAKEVLAEASEPPLLLSRDLFYGKRGDDVLKLQVHLAQHGYYPEAQMTGYFGQLTRSAVSRYQKLNNIAPTAGYVGAITREALGR